MEQNFILTPCPNGADDNGNLKISCVISIQLKPSSNKKLKDFNDILDYAEKLQNAQFAVLVNDNQEVEAEVVSQPALDTDLWSDLFHQNIKVRSFQAEDLTQKRMHSYPVKHVIDYLDNLYTNVGINKPDELLTIDEFIDNYNLVEISRYDFSEKFNTTDGPKSEYTGNSFLQRKREGREVLKSLLNQNKYVPFSSAPNPTLDFAMVRDFHKTEMNVKGVKGKLKKIDVPDFEFHDMLAVINNYPAIQRKLGLVVDLIVPGDELLATGNLRMIPSGFITNNKTSLSAPAVSFEYNKDKFISKPATNGPIEDGYLKINNGEFVIHQIDTDSAAIKTSQMADNQIQQKAQLHAVKLNLAKSKSANMVNNKPARKEEGLPHLRTGGIALAQNGRAGNLFSRFQQSLDFSNKMFDQSQLSSQYNIIFPKIMLYADDLLQGYRMDIALQHEPNEWYSLHWRDDEYKYQDKNGKWKNIPGSFVNEGYIETALAEDTDDPQQVYLHENMFRWEGWSLSVPRPGYAVNESEEMSGPEQDKKDFVHTSKSEENKKYEIPQEINFKLNSISRIVPGTLPRLRYGETYRVRVRVVDLASNSLPLEDTKVPLNCLFENFTYHRYEPVTSPTVLLGNNTRDAESLETIAIRSNYDKNSQQYEDAAGEGHSDSSVRHLLPPRSNQQQIEAHGRFDAAFTGEQQKALAAYQLITQRDQVITNTQSQVVSNPVIDFLPDPMAIGVAFFPDDSDAVVNNYTQGFPHLLLGYFENDEVPLNYQDIDNGGSNWYNPQPVSIHLAEGDFEVKWDSGQRALRVWLPKGERIKIKYASLWRGKDLEAYNGIWAKIKRKNPKNLPQLKELAYHGKHWMLSPFRYLVLSHALQQPLQTPNVEELWPQRVYNYSEAWLNTRFNFHGPSTEKLFLTGTWQEPIDDLTEKEFYWKQMKSNSIDLHLDYHGKSAEKGYFPDEVKMQPQQSNQAITNVDSLEKKTMIQNQKAEQQNESILIFNQFKKTINGSVKIKVMPKEQKVAVAPVQYSQALEPQAIQHQISASEATANNQQLTVVDGLLHKFPDTRHRWVDYSVSGNSRYKDYFSNQVENNDAPTSRTGNTIARVNILNTARPSTLKVDYTIPIFSWQKWQNDIAMHHKRNGGGVRVYLKRPWFTTGEDELLGVIIHPRTAGHNPGSTSPASQEVTRWAKDPILIYNRDMSSPGPEPDDFELYEQQELVNHPDGDGKKLYVIGFPVKYDEKRQLWFADIEISPRDKYFPFIKLAVSRYQPHSLRSPNKDVCLSTVDSLDFVQLMPDREARVDFKKEDVNTKFTVTVKGQMHSSGNIRNRLVISFLDTELAQPYDSVIDIGENDNKLAKDKVSIVLDGKHIKNGFFEISEEFKLPSKYKKNPYRIIINEYEVIGSTKSLERVFGFEPPRDTERIVYTDVFDVNVED